jgi:hypothetical protein
MRSFPVVLAPLLALPVLVACGDEGADDGAVEAAATSAAASAAERSPGPSPSAPGSSPPAATDPPGAASPGKVPRPGPGSCEPVPESPDGRYVVADAGEVTLRLEDGSVRLDVSASDGWGTTAAHTPIEAVVTFTGGGEALVLEAEREDRRLVIRICDDDG